MKRNKLFGCIQCSTLFGGILLSAPSALVQAEELAADSVEEVIVTARRREETLTEIPMSISAISATDLADRNWTSATDLFRTLAGAAMPRNQLILRGLSGGNSSAPDTTSTFVDGVPFDFSNLADIERVEVLRGPQGTLYGSNAIGGTVRIITRKPDLNSLEVFGSAQTRTEADVEGYDTNHTLGFNLPVIEGKLGLRVSANREKDQRQFVNINTGLQSEIERGFIRSKLLWQATDDLDVTLGYANVDYSRQGATQGDMSQPTSFRNYSLTEDESKPYGYSVDLGRVPCADPSQGRPACLSQKSAPRIQTEAPQRYQVWNSIDTWYRDETDLFTLNINHANVMDLFSVTYAGSYREYESQSLDDWSRPDALDLFKTWIVNDESTSRVTQELRFQGVDESSPLTWTLGAFFDHEEYDNLPNYQNQYHEAGDITSALALELWGADATQIGIETFGDPQNNWRSSIVSDYAWEMSYFADVAYALDLGGLGELELNVGVRRYDIRDGSHSVSQGIWSDSTTVTSGREQGNRFKYSASWRPSEKYSVYALYSEGYRPGGNNGPLAQSCSSDPFAKSRKDRYTSDKIDNYEFGFKSAKLGGIFDISAAVYQIDWTDIRTSVYMGTCGFRFTANAGKARSRGAELESVAHLGDTTRLTFNASYTNAEVLEDNDSIDAKAGDKMSMVPEWNAYVAIDQDFAILGRSASARLDYTFYDEYKSHFRAKEEDTAPAYGFFNASAGVDVSEGVRVSAHINNLLNEEIITYRTYTVNTGAHAVEYLEGRGMSLRLDYSF